MRLGLSAGPETLDLAVELGIRGVPINIDQIIDEGIDKTLAPLRERGLQVCQIGAFGYNPLSADREGQEKQTAMIEQLIPLAPEIGCNYITICGGNYHPSGFGAGDARNFTDQALDEVAEVLKPVLVLAEEFGVYLTIEPYLKTAIYSPERFLALHARVGTDALAEGFHIHAGLVPLGEGVTDWAKVLKLMAPNLPDDSWVVLEHVETAEEARNSFEILQKAAAEVNVTLE